MQKRTCPECSGEVTGHPARRYCSDLCKHRAAWAKRGQGRRYRDYLDKRNAKYIPVADPWAANRTQSAVCIAPGCEVEPLALSMCRSHYRLARGEYGTGGQHERRARRYGVEYVPGIRRSAVGERDGWLCGICGGPVDRALSFPDLGSQSLDHVVPMILGGGHTWENVQLAHFGCNLTKGYRVEPVTDQLLTT